MYILKRELEAKDRINKIISEKYGVPVDIILSKDRSKYISFCRFMAYYILRKKFNMSYPTIAGLYDKDHTTIMYGVQEVVRKGREDEAMELINSPQEVSQLSTPPQIPVSQPRI